MLKLAFLLVNWWTIPHHIFPPLPRTFVTGALTRCLGGMEEMCQASYRRFRVNDWWLDSGNVPMVNDLRKKNIRKDEDTTIKMMRIYHDLTTSKWIFGTIEVISILAPAKVHGGPENWVPFSMILVLDTAQLSGLKMCCLVASTCSPLTNQWFWLIASKRRKTSYSSNMFKSLVKYVINPFWCTAFEPSPSDGWLLAANSKSTTNIRVSRIAQTQIQHVHFGEGSFMVKQ